MIELLQPYVSITLKLVMGMMGILAFLRITGKIQYYYSFSNNLRFVFLSKYC